MMHALNFTCSCCGITDLVLLAQGSIEPIELRDEFDCFMCMPCYTARLLSTEEFFAA